MTKIIHSNTYQVVVRASDGNNNDYFKVSVSVTDVEETGKVTWTVAPSGVVAPGTDIWVADSSGPVPA